MYTSACPLILNKLELMVWIKKTCIGLKSSLWYGAVLYFLYQVLCFQCQFPVVVNHLLIIYYAPGPVLMSTFIDYPV